MTHPADGVYYLSSTLLRRNHACQSSQRKFTRAFGSGEVLVTFENAQIARHLDLSFPWVLSMMRFGQSMTPRVTAEEMREYNFELSRSYTTAARAWAFMNLIQRRAMREGLLPQHMISPHSQAGATFIQGRSS